MNSLYTVIDKLMKEWVSQFEFFSKITLRGKRHMPVVYLGENTFRIDKKQFSKGTENNQMLCSWISMSMKQKPTDIL